jgi:hypothetical protein
MIATEVQSTTQIKDVTIAAGATGLSDVIDLEGFCGGAVDLPAGWLDAPLSFQAASARDGTFKNVKDSAGTEVKTATLSASTIYSLDDILLKLYPLRYIKIRSGLNGAAVNQTGAPVIGLILKG